MAALGQIPGKAEGGCVEAVARTMARGEPVERKSGFNGRWSGLERKDWTKDDESQRRVMFNKCAAASLTG